MANTYYDSQLTAAEIEAALEAIDGVIVPANNGKVLAINNGKLEARSVQWGGGAPVLEPLSVTANGDYTPASGVDGFDEVHVSVPNSYTASDEGKVVSNGALVAQTARSSQITQNGTYDTTLNNEVTVNVSGGGSAVVQPLSVTQNGTYNPPSGVDGYAPVVVNVPGGGSTNILSGSADPTSAQGSNGNIYLKYFLAGENITNVRMVIYGVRTAGSDTQVSEVQLLDSNDNVILWGNGTATSNGNVYSSSQTPEKAFDNITNDKWYTNSKPSESVPIWIDFEPDTPIATNTIYSWQWWTGDDSSGRDPVTFDLQLSFDGGNTYIIVDHVDSANIPTSRNALAYTNEVLIESGAITNTYCKVNGIWQLLIGTNINDVNLGGN